MDGHNLSVDCKIDPLVSLFQAPLKQATKSNLATYKGKPALVPNMTIQQEKNLSFRNSIYGK